MKRLTQRQGTLIYNFYLKICDAFSRSTAGIIVKLLITLNKTSKNRDKYIKKTTSSSTAVLNFKNYLKSPHITEKLNNIIGENAYISYSKFDKILQDLISKHFPSKYVNIQNFNTKNANG